MMSDDEDMASLSSESSCRTTRSLAECYTSAGILRTIEDVLKRVELSKQDSKRLLWTDYEDAVIQEFLDSWETGTLPRWRHIQEILTWRSDDAIRNRAVREHGYGSWKEKCEDRSQLAVERRSWTDEEDELIRREYDPSDKKIWGRIASMLDGRSRTGVRNRAYRISNSIDNFVLPTKKKKH